MIDSEAHLKCQDTLQCYIIYVSFCRRILVLQGGDEGKNLYILKNANRVYVGVRFWSQ